VALQDPGENDMEIADVARTVMERCDVLAGYSEEHGRLTRRFASHPMKEVNRLVETWMRQAGMATRQDHAGNIIGRYEGQGSSEKVFLLGSHLDTVRDAGKYDGVLGVLVALAGIELLHDRRERLPFALEIIGFADEEGLRYHYPFLGSKALTGSLEKSILYLTDEQGIPLIEAIRHFGGKPEALIFHCSEQKRYDDWLGYCEVHIEQGPVLEAKGLPVGVVTAITGLSRCKLVFEGEANHAGTQPMALRRDALCAAAEFVLAVERYAGTVEGLVATVGQLQVSPGAINVIPGRVSLSLDVRHQVDAIRREADQKLFEEAIQICTRRGIQVAREEMQETPTIPCTPWLMQLLEQAIDQVGGMPCALPSGAGHDAMIMSRCTDIAMLFVRCLGGISHHPAESVCIEDVAQAIRVMERFFLLLKQHVL
jgi:allantoate deiminase